MLPKLIESSSSEIEVAPPRLIFVQFLKKFRFFNETALAFARENSSVGKKLLPLCKKTRSENSLWRSQTKSCGIEIRAENTKNES
jgi:hypothetical protein